MGAAVAPVFAPLAALPALFLVLPLLLLVDDLHLQAADVEGYRAEPEEGDAAHHRALEQQRRHRQQHHPPEGEDAADVRGAAERHTHTSQDEEGWGGTDWHGVITEIPELTAIKLGWSQHARLTIWVKTKDETK